jgi:predicted 3-demethylubiquinone-9 3-methyltransferase (glyoxalase superfamily)
MSAITPHLWFDAQAKEAAGFYTSTFGNSEIVTVNTIRDTPSGDCDIVSFVLEGQPFQAISAGPLFTLNPSVSFTVNCSTADEVDALWKTFIEGGMALMPLDAYPFSDRYGWLQDRYGVSWQIMLPRHQPVSQKIVPSLLFVGDVCGKCEEAVTFYTSVFPDSNVAYYDRYGKGEEPDVEGTVRHTGFTLNGYELTAMDSAHEHQFAFNEAISLMVYCDTQDQIDHYWEKLSAVPEAEQCGWLKDRYGVSWQIVPRAMEKMMADADRQTLDRVTEAFLKMKKFDIAELEEAYAGR